MFQTPGVELACRRGSIAEVKTFQRVAVKGVVAVAEALHDRRSIDIAAVFRSKSHRRTGEVGRFLVQREILCSPLDIGGGAFTDRNDAVAVVGIERVEQSDLLLIVPAGGLLRRCPRGMQRGKKKRCKNCKDRNRNEGLLNRKGSC